MGKKVLIIDDSTFMRNQIRDILKEEGFEIVGMSKNGETAIDMAIELKPDLITLDNMLPDMTGIDMLRVFKEQDLHSTIIMISAVGQQSVINEAKELGAAEYIVKPFTSQQLVQVSSRLVT